MKYSKEFTVICGAKTEQNRPPGGSVNNFQIALDFSGKSVVVVQGTFTEEDLEKLSTLLSLVREGTIKLDCIKNVVEKLFKVHAIDGELVRE